MLPVSRLWFGCSRPTLLISGQSLCSGCGSDVILCARESLFTNSTRVPGEMVSCVTLTPADVMVTVLEGLPPPDGEDGDPPPHAAIGNNTSKGRSRRTRGLSHAPRGSRLPPRYWTVIVPWNAGFESLRWSWNEQVPAFAKAWVTFVCPVFRVPSPASIDGQVPCCG